MEITVLETIKIDKIPSGSGIVKSGDIYYIIGDDSPFLFSLDKELNPISKIPLLDPLHFSDERIIKSKKPDFEAMELITANELVVFGSGSKSPERAVFMRILLNEALSIEKYDISEFYNNLKKLLLLRDTELNIEAAAFRDKQIFLFNRKKNLIITFEYESLLSHFKGEIAFPKPKITPFILPKLNGIEAGFSGATALKGTSKIIFTASVEHTDTAYDDGEISGSFIGMIDVSTSNISEFYKYCLIPTTGVPLKVESVTIEEEMSPGKTKIIMITDDDKGNSIVLKSVLTW